MKMFHPALVGILPVFVLPLGIRLNARADLHTATAKRRTFFAAGALFSNSAGHFLLEGGED